ncbi:beta-galactosidase [Deminuibacter soli]|uniref:Beta-galactosidase n=2 Tax=Deminuibacter soli TaxID=2291815 RepID=A0A3E1NGY9_9BACT|nr:beta-galactosidase [Deminuibacter soli]
MLLLLAQAQQFAFAQPATGKQMKTPWAKDAARTIPLNEYPRPQLVRGNWTNLNGLWDYTIQPKNKGIPDSWKGKIMVPFPVESVLSGVQQKVGPDSLLWYRRTFRIQQNLAGKKVLLHIGAADYEATVLVNGKPVATHKGGYTAFSADITASLKGGNEELLISVWDPTDHGEQARGKQVTHPGGIYYTSVTGIWQTVWFEVVPETYLQSWKTTTDIDQSVVTIRPRVTNAQNNDSVTAAVFFKKKQVAVATVAANEILRLAIPGAQLWSPDKPVLYDVQLAIKRGGKTVDKADGYFGMRNIAVAKDAKGVNRIFFNHEPLFQYGPLDQGFWPDGIYTAPTEQALVSDIRNMKDMGFNMVRKHVKVEPERWYYNCDKLGLIVWQDMPSGYGEIVPVKDHDHSTEGDWMATHYQDVVRSAASEQDFRDEWSSIMQQLHNYTSISVWVPFNESWGQFKTNEILQWTKALDPTRLVDGPSGWIDRGEGDMHDYHLYGSRLDKDFPLENNRALVIGEFGGLGYLDSLHVYDGKVWSYNGYKNTGELLKAYEALMNRIAILKEKGFSAAVYTQLTDVETEINGLITYDRIRRKLLMNQLKQLHGRLYVNGHKELFSSQP